MRSPYTSDSSMCTASGYALLKNLGESLRSSHDVATRGLTHLRQCTPTQRASEHPEGPVTIDLDPTDDLTTVVVNTDSMAHSDTDDSDEDPFDRFPADSTYRC